MTNRLTLLVMLLIFAAQIGSVACAGNIDLVTLPSRDGVQLTIYNSEDITLVKETRSLAFKRGTNSLQFSWANTLIDPSSVEFRPIEHKDEITLVDTVFPGLKPQHLVWNIDSKFEGQARVEVSYFTSGLSWAMDYTAITNPDETLLSLNGFVSVTNGSGENYENAQIRLVVGNINLVEKISDLAKRKGLEVTTLTPPEYDELRHNALWDAMDGNNAPSEDAFAEGAAQIEEKQVIKEGLSEYFIFTIEGRETVPHSWTKRMGAVNAANVPFEIVYRMRDYQYGPRPVRFYVWNNDTEHKLGESPLPDGMISVFRDNGRDGLAFCARQYINYVPIRADIEINLGADDLVVYKTVKAELSRGEFSFRSSGRQEYVDGWKERTLWKDVVSNYRSKPIKFELRRVWQGDVEYSSDTKGGLFDYQTVETVFSIEGNTKKNINAEVTALQGRLAKQARVVVK